ncbi:13132_t:CDS:2 [Racocetra fulgida]|uniref:13132_t:CDS:1 n=1 Tax=Racocetra fulgida TaxID=60492 RepID=A0A9N9IT24_9GLOM|nr:13132_t:CDS:2 [Racocetra fulgida]
MHIKWDIKDFAVSQEISNPIQIVSHYLDVYNKNKLCEKDIPFTGQRRVNKTIESKRCLELLQKYFLNNNDENITSCHFVKFFLEVLADQLVYLSSSSFTVDNLKLMVGNKDINTTLMKTLLEKISSHQIDPSLSKEQKIWELDDYHTMSASSLLEKLKHIV